MNSHRDESRPVIMSVLCRCVFHFLYVVTVLRYYMSMFFAKLLPYYAVTRFFFHFSNVITLLRYYMILCRSLPFYTPLPYYTMFFAKVITLLPYYPTLLRCYTILWRLRYVLCKVITLLPYYATLLRCYTILCRCIFHYPFLVAYYAFK